MSANLRYGMPTALGIVIGLLPGTAAANNIIVVPTLGGDHNGACAISENGIVVGWSINGDGFQEGFAWDLSDPVMGIGTAGGSFSIANFVNSNGQVAGDSFNGDNSFRAVQWAQADGIDAFRDVVSFANSINDNGILAGGEDVGGNLIATIWDSDGSPTHLGTLGGNTSLAYDINAAGQVVGGAFNGDGVRDPFLWTEGGGMMSLGNLGGPYSGATSINDNGQVAGFSEDGAGNELAFLWEDSAGIMSLGTLGGDTSRATDVNNLGQVVGASEDADGNQVAFFWSEQTGMIDLMELVKDDVTGWTSLFVADGINDAGQIVGTGIYEGETRGFVLTIPGPGGLVLLVIAGMLARTDRRRAAA